MKKYLLLLLTFLTLTKTVAQEQQTLKLSPEQIEALFIKNNLQLIAERLNIDIANANIAQAKLWDNPNLSVIDVNLWSTKAQREGEDEVIPPLFGSFGRNQQFGVELSQLILTANKRSKLINMGKVSKEMAIQEFEDVLRGLKVELRKSISETIYLQSYLKVLNGQKQSLSELINAYRKQVTEGNVAKNELLRLQSLLLEMDNEINEIQTDYNEQQKTLKILLSIEPHVTIEFENNSGIDVKNPEGLSLAHLIDLASESRPDIKRYKLETQYHEKSLAYERAQRIPDVTVIANYDRFGGVWKNFVGVGVSVDLPVFNRNQGNIRAARISRDQSQYQALQQQNTAQHEIAESFGNYTIAYKFYKQISENSLLSELDSMLDVYTKNFSSRNISMLEYIDFMDAYKSNKQTILTSEKNLNIQFEELQYTVGAEIK